MGEIGCEKGGNKSAEDLKLRLGRPESKYK